MEIVMPIWSNDPPAEPRGPALPIRRTPAHKPLDAIVTSEDLIGCYTHFYKGHTVPCEGDDCPAHLEGIPYRWHAYLAAIDCTDGLHFIFEVTAQAAEHFTAYRECQQTLRGCRFRARRLNNRPNGRVLIQTKPADLTERRLPHGPDLTQCMAIIWSLPAGSVTDQRRDPERKMPTAVVDPEPKKTLTELVPHLAELHKNPPPPRAARFTAEELAAIALKRNSKPASP